MLPGEGERWETVTDLPARFEIISWLLASAKTLAPLGGAWAADIVTARQRAAESGKPMLLFFSAEWCVPCRIMKREVFADPEAMTAINATVVPVMISEGQPGADAAFTQYNVGGTPVTIFTDSEGRVLDYEVGGIGKDRFMEMLGGLDSSKS